MTMVFDGIMASNGVEPEHQCRYDIAAMKWNDVVADNQE